MPHQEMASALFSGDTFRGQFGNAQIRAALNLFRSVEAITPSTSASQVDWDYLLNAAALLTQSTTNAHRASALSISHACLTDPDTDATLKARAAFILEILANAPAFQLAVTKGFVRADLVDALPLPLFFDVTRTRVDHSIVLKSGTKIIGNDFQRDLWIELQNHEEISATAPTSSGKSFLLEQWIVDQSRGREKFRVVYLVPTRALISQVERELGSALQLAGTQDASILTLPFQIARTSRVTVMIMTQERLLLAANDEDVLSSIDVVIVDEAQKLGDGARGFLLQSALDRIRARSSSAKILFLSPFSENPEELFDRTRSSRPYAVVKSNESTVDQFLFWVTQHPGNSFQWEIEWVRPEERTRIGTLTLPNRPNTKLKRLALVAYGISSMSPGNVVYVNGAADAEEISHLIYDSLPPKAPGALLDQEIVALQEMCQRSVHREFLLSSVLSRGVAFHYGSMPQVIRTEIERLFTDGKSNI